MENLLKEIDTKRELVRVTRDAMQRALDKRNTTSAERQKKTIVKTVEEVYELKVKIQELKIQQGDDAEEIREWTDKIEQELEVYDDEVANVDRTTSEWKQQEDVQLKQREEEMAAKTRQELFKEQLEFDKAKFEQKIQQEMKLEEARKAHKKTQSTNAKLPKLVISKFDGTPLDWMRFWNQFEAEIDQAEVPPVTKFSYLKELVGPKVRSSIDGLPVSTEGYERAKNILNTKYGDKSEIVNAYVQKIMYLPTIHGTNPGKIHDFYDKLLFSVQSLETMGKLKEVNGYVRMCVDKLEGIRSDLVRTDDDWREWDFVKFVDALRKWTERNPVRATDKPVDKTSSFRTKTFQTRQREVKQRRCVYCNEISHMSINCAKVVTSEARKKFLSENRLCFNCTGAEHRASDCRSRFGCSKCKRRHHTSICDASSETVHSNETLLKTATNTSNRSVVYPVVIVDVHGVKCRALIDTGAGSSYASSALLEKIKAKPRKKEIRRVEMMLGTSTKLVGHGGPLFS